MKSELRYELLERRITRKLRVYVLLTLIGFVAWIAQMSVATADIAGQIIYFQN